MRPRAPRDQLGTHEVLNQPAERADLALWEGDAPLRAAIEREGASAHASCLAAFAAAIGTGESVEEGRLANRFPPELQAFDRGGRRIDEVVFHPAYHALMRRGAECGYAALPWTSEQPFGHVAHAAMVYLLSQVEPGVCCPLTMTYAAVPALRHTPEVAAEWVPRATAARYDPASRPAGEKAGATIGMAMTEKQGGSDVRANTTRAAPDGDCWRLTGHKWFCSAPMSDAFLTLAQTDAGLTCFVVPRWAPDGSRNPIHLMRLKDKLGNRANASAEIEYHGAFSRLLGEQGRGVRTIVEMVHHTRLDTAMAPAGLMRRALSEAAYWCRHRFAFQRRLIDQPLMRMVLADLAVDWIGALAMGLRVAAAFDRSAGDSGEAAFARLAVAVAKYWSNKRCPQLVFEAMESMGGVGYVEEGPMPLLYREAPLNSIWEGSGNVICLDVLRTIEKTPAALEAFIAELQGARGADRRFDAALDRAVNRWSGHVVEADARRFTETLALLFQASLLIRAGEAAVADAFVATRLEGDWGRTYGTLPVAADAEAIAALI